MPEILSPDRFRGRYEELKGQYELLREKFPDDDRFRKVKRNFRLVKSTYGRDKVYAVKYLNYFESLQVGMREERRAWVVRVIELLQKVILHKKLNRED